MDTGFVAKPENVCVCFHVPLNKIVKHIRLNDPKVASQVSECYGAGTGCGWCIPFLEKIFEAMQAAGDPASVMNISAEEYLARRMEYRKRINAERMQDVRKELSDADDLID